MLHSGKKLHLSCNNYKMDAKGNIETCHLQVGQTVNCQFFPDPSAKEGSGYDYICGSERLNGNLTSSAKNELLELEKDEQAFLLTHSEPTVHHYVGSPCGLWGKESCEEPEAKYTFLSDKAKIVVHCQSWDERSLCGGLKVGTAYHCHLIAADKFWSQTLACVGVGYMEIDRSDLK